MRLSRLILPALAIAALVGVQPAGAFSITDGGSLNSGAAAHLTDPDDQAAHIANGGQALGESGDDRALPSSGSSAGPASSATPGTARWSDSWFAKTDIIGGDWKYPPISP
jgi:hypothetical protein